MRAILIFLGISWILITVQSQTQWCIWGKTGNVDVEMNGLYLYDGEYGGYPSFVKTIGAGCPTSSTALWYSGSAWRLTVGKGDQSGFNSPAECSQSSLSNCGAQQWGSGNEGVFAMAGSCPEWPCVSVSSTFPTYNCGGPFTKDVGTNAWSNDAGTRFLFFVPHVFRWFCDSAVDQTSCPSYGFAYSEQAWFDLSTETSTSATWIYADAQGTSHTVLTTFTCTGAHVTASTSNPTKRPTTEQPTANPSYNPTQRPVFTRPPTPYPIPTAKPVTYDPAQSPATNPSYNPATNPVIHPAYNPVVNPVYNPAQSPDTNPAINPAFAPSNAPTTNPLSSTVANPETSSTDTAYQTTEDIYACDNFIFGCDSGVTNYEYYMCVATVLVVLHI
eukprot:796963_1